MISFNFSELKIRFISPYFQYNVIKNSCRVYQLNTGVHSEKPSFSDCQVRLKNGRKVPRIAKYARRFIWKAIPKC